MLPVVALVGRPNVGKSTLFNFLTLTRNALVADFPGLTRDRQYGQVRRGERPFLVVDTGGIIEQAEGLEDQAMRQVWAALDEAEVILFMVDARAGLSSADESIASKLRKTGKPVLLVANKIDGLTKAESNLAEFYRMGLIGQPIGIASSHGTGIPELLEQVYALLPPSETEAEEDETAPGIRVAIIGRPNVGKSTLVNRLLGEERVVVFDQPGTTRDSIFIPFERDGRQYTCDAHSPIGHSLSWLGGPGQAHWNCRSSSTPVLKSWKELGLDMNEMPEGTRASMDGQVAANLRYGDWFGKQSAARQDQIVGVTRGRMFRAGEMLFDQFSNNKGRLLTLKELAHEPS